MSNGPDPIELTRGLLNKTAELRHGFLDVLGESTSSPVPTFAQQAMNSPFVATVYERLWRPISFYLASGVSNRAEQHRAAAALHLSSAERLLDVACGPGNFTGPLTTAASRIGLTMFDGQSFVDLFRSAGLVGVDQQTQRALQFVAARKPS
jgi:tRNA/tmRNA/rRNA uracil-C5-methylase (TrmA/RlmC/RlmD family)